ncbi:Spermidine-binding periplasmic protein SpuE [bacterium HR12]|nr:Spermidine-binding periplasmic protein SpuE [bacterium HR12]GIU98678.1 MAG: polyamine-binding lipoprotein [Actinomycetota bacterium]
MTARFTRRDLLRRAGAGAAAIALSGLAGACGRREGPEREPSFRDPPAGILNFANWPLYIDMERRGDGTRYSPSLVAFEADTGIHVNYREVIRESDWFYQRIEPYLAAGLPTGWDLMVITNGITLTKLKERGYLVELPSDLRPNFDAHAGDFVRDPAYDPGNRYTMAWQSGITGIAYDPEVTGGPVTSLQALFDPAYRGKVGMFGDIVDMPNLALLALGVAPETSTEEDWRAAAELLVEQRDSGILAGYYQQTYIAALRRGDLGITMAWSGDMFAAKSLGKIPERIEFVVPEEGALLWTDNMCIPQGARHLADAITFMDWVYRPEAAAQIAQFVNYITPVPEARQVLERMAEEAEEAGDRREAERLREVAQSELVFPSDTSNLHTYRELPSDEEVQTWESIFRPIYEGA